jgi:hypothetical protein
LTAEGALVGRPGGKTVVTVQLAESELYPGRLGMTATVEVDGEPTAIVGRYLRPGEDPEGALRSVIEAVRGGWA